MTQPNDALVKVPPALTALFGPIRWWRRQWVHTWFKVASTVLISIVLILILGMWSGCEKRSSWEEWLANFRFRGAPSGRSSSGGRDQRHATARDKMPPLTYFGNGRAELGDYSICVFDPITQSTLRTDFKLEGATKLGDEATFQQFMERNGRFFQEQVAVVFRTHNLDDLESPDLDLLGRKIVARVNRSLGEKMLESAKIKNFCLSESIDRSGFVPHDLAREHRMP